MDLFRQVHGPYTKEEVKGLLRRGNNFFVATPTFDRWVPVDFIPEFTYIPPLPANDAVGWPVVGVDALSLERALDELIGICKGVIADGKVVPEEAVFLRDWLDKNQQVTGHWPANVLSDRLQAIFADGKVDEQEQQDLLELLRKITAEKPSLTQLRSQSSPLPVNLPEPEIQFAGRQFCLAGRFLYGPRQRCAEAILSRGGSVGDHPDASLNYLIIGTFSQADWPRSGDGPKIELAVALRGQGQPVAIVSEEHWNAGLAATAATAGTRTSAPLLS